MINVYEELIKIGINKEDVLLNEDMSKHTSFKTGGKAKYFIKINLLENLVRILEFSKENNIPIFILGNGTNILVKDEGFNGIVLQLMFNNIKIYENIVIVEAGVKNAVLANKLLNAELTGFEFASGIPGTIGGAIKMNAGAYGSEIKDIVEEVTYLDYNGKVHTIKKEECKFDYRHSKFFDEKAIILSAKFLLKEGNKKDIESTMKDLLAKRKEKQPIEYPNAGSTFKRGINFITAQVIDECGLKGYCIGGAEVSTKHAGFIINKNNATATDIINLINYVKKVVKEKTNKDIELEIEII